MNGALHDVEPVPVRVVDPDGEARANRRVGYVVLAALCAPVLGVLGRIVYEAAAWGWRLLG